MELEARNVVLQYDYVIEEAPKFSAGLKLTTKTLSELHTLAIQDLYSCAGRLREVAIAISDTDHQPPSAPDVPRLVCEMCDYINDNWSGRSAIHLSAYAMWRHNWIHPFQGGNGRTSRALSYLILCGKLGMILPGTTTVPQQIVENNRRMYYAALKDADAAWKSGKLDVGVMEELLSNLLASQLYGVVERAVADRPKD